MTVNRALCQCGMSCCLRHGSWSLPRGVCLPGQCCWCGGAAGVGPQSWKSRGLYLPLQLSLFSSSPDLYRHLHRPLVHKVLALVCPVRHLVVPGLGQAAAGRPAHPVLQTLGHLEVHEGLFPCLREYQALGEKGPPVASSLWGQEVCGAESWLGGRSLGEAMEEHSFSLAVGPGANMVTDE